MAQAGKKCTRCGSLDNEFEKNRNVCKVCRASSARGYHLFNKYGITEEIYKEMLERQNSSCDICGTKETSHRYGTFNVDHCHETGKVRALLCNSCNTALGQFKDNPALLRKAAEYIEYWKEGVPSHRH